MTDTLEARRCPHGKRADDWCIRCVSDELIALRLKGLSYAKCGAAMGYSATTARSWIKIRARERGMSAIQ